MPLEAFTQLDPDVTSTFHFNDGDDCAAGATIGEVTGSARALLSAERTALNFLQHCPASPRWRASSCARAGEPITILDTRKTTPMLRALEKYAVRAGGATNHRMSLDDGVLIKDNHIRLGGGITNAVARMRASGAEAGRSKSRWRRSIRSTKRSRPGADILLLDNMTIDHIREAVRRSRGRAKTEISGGVTLEPDSRARDDRRRFRLERRAHALGARGRHQL